MDLEKLDFMYESKLIRLLKTFSRREMSRFEEFALSPYFNKHEEVRRLVSYLSEVYPRLDEQRCHRERLFAHLFPGSAHDQGKLAVLFTYTQRLADEFLTQEYLRGQPLPMALYRLKHLRRRHYYEPYEGELAGLRRAVGELPGGDRSFHFWHYRVAAEADAYFDQIERRQTDLSIQEKQRHLDYFFLAEKLRDACEMHVRAKILRVDYDIRLLEAALTELRDHPEWFRDVPAVWLYYQIYRMITCQEEHYFFDALESLYRYEQQFTETERKSLYNYFQNYCIERINQGYPHFLKEIFRLYQAQLQQGLLLENGKLSEWHYKNMVTTGIRLREMEWVRTFIERYRDHLPVEARENAYRFNLASYHYAAGEYNQVLDLLFRVEYSDLRYSLGAKALLLRTYYDLEEYDALYSLTDSFRQYLYRNKLMADGRRQGYYNLFKLTRRAAQIREQRNYARPQALRRQLDQLQTAVQRSNAIFNKAWLEEKIGELEAAVGCSEES